VGAGHKDQIKQAHTRGNDRPRYNRTKAVSLSDLTTRHYQLSGVDKYALC
jgi:hypothetical protein